FQDVKERLILVSVAFVALARLERHEVHVQTLAAEGLVARLHDVPALTGPRPDAGADQPRHTRATLALLLGQRVRLALDRAHKNARLAVALGVFPDRTGDELLLVRVVGRIVRSVDVGAAHGSSIAPSSPC